VEPRGFVASKENQGLVVSETPDLLRILDRLAFDVDPLGVDGDGGELG
jgi:hypothetical protein